MTPADRLIVALDHPEVEPALALADRLYGTVRWLKVGMTLFFRGGRRFVRDLDERGFSVFVDLKCHDIPYQVQGAVAGLADLGAGLVTVHTAGGEEMLRAAVRAADGTDTRILGVTVLTSLDRAALRETGIDETPGELVRRRTSLAVRCGLDGVVASPLEAGLVRDHAPPGLEIVTPGIRPRDAAEDDQRRVATPEAALHAGATRLVVGRPITQSGDPVEAARAILAEIEAAP
ncbi:MAG: orotidine-5'-phosphate decarboxylase [Myxococcota bacterium]